MIQGRHSPETYIGVLHKVLGTFPIKDMRIFQGTKEMHQHKML